MDAAARRRRFFRLHVELADIAPPIWRELEVAGELTLFELHIVLQRAFGWQNYHLWRFDIDGISYGDVDDELDFEDPDRTLESVITGRGARFSYGYDFGDDWIHAIEVRAKVEKVSPDATCLDGARACPPEDCGGPFGYARLLEALADTAHPEHAEFVEWCGAFDPESFDRSKVNEHLAEPWDEFFDQDDDEFLLLLELLGDEHLPEAVRDEILGSGRQIASTLIDILADPDLYDTSSPGSGWAPIHAVRLLVDLGAARAVAPMLDALEITGWADILHDRIIVELPRLGMAVVEPSLARLLETDGDTKTALLSILARTGVRDERIFRHLISYLDEDLEMAAGDLADYGDPAALPHLLERYDAILPAPESGMSIIELAEAIQFLGGRLTKTQEDKLELARSLHRSRFLPPAPVRRKKIGRNDPCHCDSGKKYKHCHLKADQAQPSLQ